MASERAARPRAPPFIDPPGYARHRPEETLLYQFVERYYPELVAAREAAGRPLRAHCAMMSGRAECSYISDGDKTHC
jgi:hypothetical protein